MVRVLWGASKRKCSGGPLNRDYLLSSCQKSVEQSRSRGKAPELQVFNSSSKKSGGAGKEGTGSEGSQSERMRGIQSPGSLLLCPKALDIWLSLIFGANSQDTSMAGVGLGTSQHSELGRAQADCIRKGFQIPSQIIPETGIVYCVSHTSGV
ncbi:hypothetical protein BJX70DRAFT_207124 [Aspergillus crustosus]